MVHQQSKMQYTLTSAQVKNLYSNKPVTRCKWQDISLAYAWPRTKINLVKPSASLTMAVLLPPRCMDAGSPFCKSHWPSTATFILSLFLLTGKVESYSACSFHWREKWIILAHNWKRARSALNHILRHRQGHRQTFGRGTARSAMKIKCRMQ